MSHNYDQINATESDLMLQEVYANDNWKMLVACILLNQTTRKQVDIVRHQLFETYPDAMEMASAAPIILSAIIKPCGLQKRRAESIIKFSRAWIEWDPYTDIIEYPGIGEYAQDSFNIFALGRIDEYVQWVNGEPLITVKDKELKKYLEKLCQAQENHQDSLQ